MIKDQKVSDTGLEDIPLYANIMISGITKVAMRPKNFPCAEVIDWILPQANTSTMIMSNIEGKYCASFTPAYIAKDCNLPALEISMTDAWINGLSLDYIECANMMMIAENQFHQKASSEYEVVSLHTPYRLISLMLNRIFGRANGKFYNIGYIPLMYHVTM